MVLLGGLEVVAAGYLVKEFYENDKAAAKRSSSSSQPHRHRKHRDSSSHGHHRPPRSSRPTANGLLMPPQPLGPPRPNSAPPVQHFAAPMISGRPDMGHGWANPNMPFNQLPHSNTWSQPQAQQINHHQGPWTGPHPPPPPPPGQLQPTPTMHYDMKTGRWQAGMLPAEIAQQPSRPRSATNDARNRRQRDRAHSSASSASSSSSVSTEYDADLAYGRPSGPRRKHDLQQQHSYERDRPQAQSISRAQSFPQPQSLPTGPPPPYTATAGEPDWYAVQNQAPKSQPALARPVASPRPGVAELDAETPGRYQKRKN